MGHDDVTYVSSHTMTGQEEFFEAVKKFFLTSGQDLLQVLSSGLHKLPTMKN